MSSVCLIIATQDYMIEGGLYWFVLFLSWMCWIVEFEEWSVLNQSFPEVSVIPGLSWSPMSDQDFGGHFSSEPQSEVKPNYSFPRHLFPFVSQTFSRDDSIRCITWVIHYFCVYCVLVTDLYVVWQIHNLFKLVDPLSSRSWFCLCLSKYLIGQELLVYLKKFNSSSLTHLRVRVLRKWLQISTVKFIFILAVQLSVLSSRPIPLRTFVFLNLNCVIR